MTRTLVASIAAAALALSLAPAVRAEGDAKGPIFVATDDAYDCGFASDGRLVAATAGGLIIGDRVLTALDGLPDTWVLRARVEGDVVVVNTKGGNAKVRLDTLAVQREKGAILAPSEMSRVPVFFQGGLLRRTAQGAKQTCTATSEGLFVGALTQAPSAQTKWVLPSLPSADVAALVGAGDTMFVGTFDRGLFRVRPTVTHEIERLSHPALNPNINALAYDKGREVLWVATARGLARCDTQSSFTCERVGDSVGKHALLLSGDGGVVAGGDESLLFVSPSGEVKNRVTHKSGAPFRAVWALAEGPKHTLLVGTTSGLYWGSRDDLTAGRDLKRAAMVNAQLPDDWVTSIASRGDDVYVGTYNAGVVHMRASGDSLAVEATDRSLGYVNPAGITILKGGDLAVATMDGLRVGSWGNFHKVSTLGRDVTATWVGTNARWVASRRGVSRF